MRAVSLDGTAPQRSSFQIYFSLDREFPTAQAGLHPKRRSRYRPMTDNDRTRRFEQMALPHLDAAYNLARWLARNDADARDVVQEAYLRAFRFFDGYQGGDARSWLLAIVRNCAFSWLARNRPAATVTLDDDTLQAAEAEGVLAAEDDPESVAIGNADRAMLAGLVESLPPVYREVIVLREIDDLSYREIAAIVGVPVGTVMSRLARARRQLQRAWRQLDLKEIAGGL